MKRKIGKYILILGGLLVLGLVLGLAIPALAADTGWVGTPVSQSGYSVTDPGNAATVDGGYAVFDEDSDWWQYTFSGLPTIPAGATITGIEVNIRAQQVGGTARDLELRLSKDGSNYTTQMRQTPNFGTSSFVYRTVGGGQRSLGLVMVSR